MGSLYPPLAGTGSAAGFRARAALGTQTVQGGISTLDALQFAGANRSTHGADRGQWHTPKAPATAGTEDSWGIARISDDHRSRWSRSLVGDGQKTRSSPFSSTAKKIFYVNQLANGFQQIDGVGLHVDLYLQSKNRGRLQHRSILTSGRVAVLLRRTMLTRRRPTAR